MSHGGWLAAVLNLLGLGGSGGVTPEPPAAVNRVVFTLAICTRQAFPGTVRRRHQFPGTICTRREFR